MNSQITLKSNGEVSDLAGADRLLLLEPSVITFDFGPEQVARFDRVGNDLVLILADGTRIVIENFFVVVGEERSDVVFIDGNEVAWWGQYTSPWTGFDIAEIERGLPPPAFAFAGVPGLLGLLAAGGLAGGGGGNAATPNRPPVAADDVAPPVVEAGVAPGGNTAEPGTPETSGSVLANDSDPDGNALSVTGVANAAGAGNPGQPLQGLYGTLTLNADGSYTYRLDNSLPATQALAAGAQVDEVFTYTISDGQGGTASATLTIPVHGTNDAPEIAGGPQSGAVTEAGGEGNSLPGSASTSGSFTASDVDSDGGTLVWAIEGTPDSTYGSFTLDATGGWRFDLDNTLPATEALRAGEVVTLTYQVRVTDIHGASAIETVTITVTGSNDTPVIDVVGSDLSGAVTEIADGAAGENTTTHSQDGVIRFTDVDAFEAAPTASFVPVVDDGSYLGSFVLAPVSASNDSVEWSFAVDDAVLDSLPEGAVLTQEYRVSITDAHGAVATQIVTITLTGTNDRPETEDDSSITSAGAAVTRDVLANDSDVDTGDTARWSVVSVDGQAISAGQTITLGGGLGTVTLDGAGRLTYLPGPGAAGQITLPYVVDDASGAANATASADWVITVVGVDISDDASLADPAVGDNVLANIDDIANVEIKGHAPVDGAISALTISDGTNTVIVPPGAITINPDGSFTVHADLTGLLDGTLTVSLTVTQPGSSPVTVTDTILKDTVTTVTIDPVIVVNGVVPTITGTGEPGASIVLEIGGTPVTVTVQPDGTWSHTPATPLAEGAVTITATATDPHGNTANISREVAGLELKDEVPGAPAHIEVSEAGLSTGSDPAATSESAQSSFTIGAGSAIDHIVIGGTLAGGAVTGGTTITLAQLQDIATTPIAPITTQYGTLTITGYDPATGIVTYDYALTGNTTDHSDSSGNDAVSEDISIAVIDGDGDIRIDTLVVSVIDDVPLVTAGAGNPVLETDESDLATGASASFADLFTIAFGADGAAASDAVVYTLEVAAAGTDSGLTDTATGSSILLYLEGGEIVGRVGDGSGPVAFRVAVDAATGVVSLDQLRAFMHPLADDVISVLDAAALLRVTVTDGDGDVISQTAQIGNRLTFRDDVPLAEDDSVTVPIGSYDAVTGNVLTGAGTGDVADTLGADGGGISQISHGSGAGQVIVAVPTGATGASIQGTYGVLTIHADGSYSYSRDPANAGGGQDVFTYTLTDGDGDAVTAELTVNINNANVTIGGIANTAGTADVVVNESKLADGTGVGAGGTVATGTFTVSTPDGAAVIRITIGGIDYDLVVNNTINMPAIHPITTPLGNEFSIISVSSGLGGTITFGYQYKLNDTEAHTAGDGRNSLIEEFTITARDMDGDTVTGTLRAGIVDDVPVVTVTTSASVIPVEESDLPNGVVAGNLAGLFEINFGADGAASANAVVYALDVSAAGVDSGLVDTATGDDILLYREGAIVVGRVGDSSGPIAFEVSVDSATGSVTLQQLRSIVHPADQDQLTIAHDAIILGVSATDADGDTTTESTGIGDYLGFIDAEPVARDDSASVPQGSYAAVTGNVLTGLGAGDVGDDLGPDGGRLTQVSFGSGAGLVTVTVPAGATGATIQGSYGILTIHADGSYSYARDPGTAGGGADVFTYTITDGDGDSDTATLTVSIANAGVSITGLANDGTTSDISVNESKLPDGTGVGAGAVSASGSFTVAAADGIAALKLTQGGTEYVVVLDNITQAPLSVTTALGNTLTISYDPATGIVGYGYTLNDNGSHATGNGRNDLIESFGISLVDQDGDTATSTLRVGIVDDIPVITAGTADPRLELDESALGTDAAQGFGGLFTIDFGADGAAANNALVYALAIDAAIASGLVDTATGQAVVFSVNGDGTLVTGTAGPGGPTVLTLTLDPATGVISFDQIRAVVHPTAAPDEVVYIANGALKLQVTATDSDGDSVSDSRDIGNRFGLRDDAPTASVDPVPGFVLPVINTQDADTLAGPDSASGNFSGAFNPLFSFGADGAAASNAQSLVYALSLQGGSALVSSGLTSGGMLVTLYQVGGGIVASTATSAAGITTANTVFGISLDTAGVATLTQFKPIDHGNTADSAEVVSLANGLVRLTATLTVSDRDGDTASDTKTINIGASFSFTDTGPTVGVTADSSLSESILRGQTQITLFHELNASVGAEQIGSTVAFASNAVAQLQTLGLTSGGEALQYTLVGTTITASTAARGTIFSVTLTQPSLANDYKPSYTFTLNKALDHLNGGTPVSVLDIAIGYQVRDADGDSASGSFTVKIQDDVPTAVNQNSISVVEGGATIAGTGNRNLMANDIQGLDGARIHQVSYVNDAGVTVTVTLTAGGNTGALNTQYGTLTVHSNGNWSFTPDGQIAHVNGAAVAAGFTYNLIDGDGDVSNWADQPILVTDTVPVAVSDVLASIVEGSDTPLTGNVIGNDTASRDGTPQIYSFTYGNLAGVGTTHTFVDPQTSVTVQTPTGALTVNRDGSWSFAPIDSFDHDATGANREAGSFSYVLVDSDGSRSNTATQPIRVTDTNPTVNAVSLTLDEKNIATLGSAGSSTVAQTTQALSILRSEDAIADVVFITATGTGLQALRLTSGGWPVSYTITENGHKLVAQTVIGEVFTLTINNPNDATGSGQSITATLTRPLDHSAGNGTNVLALPIAYQVHDIDSAVNGSLTFNVVDDIPAVPVNDRPVVVIEGGASTGSLQGAANLLANDVKGADGARIYDISYTDRAGVPQSNVAVPATGLVVYTQYGTLLINREGDWAYTPVASANHQKPDNDLTLRDDFTYRVIDGDGDVSAGSATQQITVIDTVPTIGTPDRATVDEKYLPTGSVGGLGGLIRNGSLALEPGQDSFAVALSAAGLPTGLTAGGLPVNYVVAAGGTTLTGYTGTYPGQTIFTVSLTNSTAANAGYRFELVKALDHGDNFSLTLPFIFTVTDSDGDSASSIFSVTVIDDNPFSYTNIVTSEDVSFTINTSADGRPGNTTVYDSTGGALPSTANPDGTVSYKTDHGTVTVQLNGRLTYQPDPNYSGTEVFRYRTVEGVSPAFAQVSVQVLPVADAPQLTVEATNINTLEDTAIALGLKRPVIVDNGTGIGNNPETERLGVITLSGLRAGSVLLDGTGAPILTVDSTGVVTIVLSDLPSVTGTAGMLTMTAAAFEALQIRPPAHDATNFTVSVSVTSYEVDASGNILGNVPGAQSIASVKVHVQAVTDDVALRFDSAATAATAGLDQLQIVNATTANATIAEDRNFDLRRLLTASFADLDGSEVRSITIENGSAHAIVVNGQIVGNGESILINATGQTGGIDSFPAITIGGVGDFSGDLTGIQVRINAQDYDADGYWTGTAPTANNVPGLSEADTTNNTVSLNLYVTPVAGDVTLAPVTTPEDTAVAFLQHVQVTDTGTTNGTEVITAVTFTIPTGWLVTPPVISNGASWSYSATASGVASITFSGGTELQREAVLDAFLITPPANSSRDLTLPVSITTVDSKTVNNVALSDTKTTNHDLVITVTPVAEVVGPSLSMTPGHIYGTQGYEDQWYTLGTEGGFDLRAGWLNQDTDELTYARLTPELLAGDGSQASAIGTEFRWFEGGEWKTAIYDGTPVDVPVAALNTLEFRPTEHFSGLFRIKVEAHTVDYDDDTEGLGTPAEATSGEVFLANLLIRPVADDVALTLNGRANGLEDTQIALSIRPSSSDPSETFNVTIGNIPVGATITYGNQTFTATAGNTSLQIENFNRSAPLSVKPPLNSSDDFPLSVTVVSVDKVTINGVTYTDVSDPVTQNIQVLVKGVADPAAVTATPRNYSEAELDSGTTKVKLADLVSASLTDTDGSEALTVRVTGMPAGFSPVGGTLVSTPGDTGTARVWLMTEAQLATATIRVPANFSGEVQFSVVAVTTEIDGNSLTGTPHAVSFTVTPSPEATVTTSAELVEDVLTSIGFGILHQNGDLDERLGNILIRVADAAGDDFTLYLGTGAGAKTLAQALADGDLTTTTVDGALYYQLDAAQAGTLAALTGPNLDGVLGGFNLKYQVIDDHFGSQPSGISTISSYQDAYFALTAVPVTDAPTVSITAISGTTATTIVTDVHTGDDATPDTATLSAADIVTVRLNVASPDHDGSEHLIRIIIDNVPAGVTVIGGEPISPTSWLLVYEAGDAKSIDAIGGIAVDLQFEVGHDAYGISGSPIRITAQVQDRGDQAGSETAVREDSVSWTLVTTYPPGAPGTDPAIIEDWIYNGAAATEDETFSLSDVITAAVNVTSTAPNIFTIRLEDLPPGTVVTGMIRTVIDGKEVWTASITSAVGSLPAATEALLADLMDSIIIRPPANWNDNNAPGGLEFSATLTTAVKGGKEVEQAQTTPEIPVTPVTDPAQVAITLDPSVGPDGVDEADGVIPLRLTVSNAADGAAGSIVGNTLYLHIAADKPALIGGTLTVDGVDYLPVAVSGVDGIANGVYYVIPDVAMGDTLEMVYAPDDLVSGTVTVSAWVRNDETGAADEATSSGSLTVPVNIGNDGVTVITSPTTGAEAPDATNASLIELSDIIVTLNDADGSERIVSILMSNLPDGFLVMTGDSAGAASAASLASNAGGTAGTNTWILSKADGSLPNYIAILPPKNWSGTLDDLVLYVTSGETALDEPLTEQFALAPITVTPVANGLTLVATNTFGAENSIVTFNLNAAIRDTEDASVVSGGTVIAADEHQETATITLKGLGANASLYVGTALITTGISYDLATDTYTLTGLSQSDLDELGFMQARNALTDQNTALAGTQVLITAWTVDGTSVSAPVSSTITMNLSAQLPTTGNDMLILTGSPTTPVNGRGGEDTVLFRYEQSLLGSELAQQLRNVEVLDLSLAGRNAITSLTPENVSAITDANKVLTILGDAEDLVSLSGNWHDNGDGSYTGTIGSGSSATHVTLHLASGIDVEAPSGGFSLTSGTMGFSFASAAQGDADGLGLSAIPAGWAEAPAGDHSDSHDSDLSETDLFAASGDDDLTVLLPEADDPAPAPAPAVPDDSPVMPPLPSVWDDELLNSAQY